VFPRYIEPAAEGDAAAAGQGKAKDGKGKKGKPAA
jgi:hypothetical protein